MNRRHQQSSKRPKAGSGAFVFCDEAGFTGNNLLDSEQEVFALAGAAIQYVATHRPDSLGWGPAEGLGADIVEGIRRAKAKEGPDLIVWGSSTLTPVLLEHGLADEVLLLAFPVLLGTGKRLFAEGTPPRELALVGSKAVPSGVIISTYRPGGPLRTGSFDDASS
jgi:dihydrofolate reductase